MAGNILTAYGTKSVSEVRGVCRVLPFSGVLWVAGFLAITGSPPFGPFLSEFTILKAALDQGSTLVAVAYLALLALIFIGMASIVLPMAQGPRRRQWLEPVRREALWADAPAVGLWRCWCWPSGFTYRRPERRSARGGRGPGRTVMTTIAVELRGPHHEPIPLARFPV